jgi:S1-C subfamily serine protease
MRSIVSASIALWLLSAQADISAADWADVIKRAEQSIVYIESDGGGCTGFVIDKARHHVMSAAHCDGDKLWVDRVAARVVSLDSKKDLMVLEVKDLDPARPALALAVHDPERGQELMSCGYGWALERPFFRVAHVADNGVQIPEEGIGGPFIGLDSAFVGGQSGGPVVNLAGEVVMIVQRASSTVGIGVGADVIRERMGRFFAQQQK